jgi:hypothetical protein
VRGFNKQVVAAADFHGCRWTGVFLGRYSFTFCGLGEGELKGNHLNQFG